MENGLPVSNRAGIKLCAGFQNGSCTETDRSRRCTRNGHCVHQCAKCLSPDHGSDRCTRQLAPAPKARGSGKSGGKGRGKGGGKPQY